jgi:hypothetical protein
MEQIADVVKQRYDRVVFQNQMLNAGFAAFPYLVMKDKNLSIGARMTYAFLLMYGWQENRSFAGQEKMAGEMGVSERQLQRYLYELRDAKYVKIERKDRRFNNTYIILDRKMPSKLKVSKAA